MKQLLPLFLAIALAGCGEPKLDGSSEQTMKASMEKVSSSLSGDSKAKFDEAIKVVLFSGINLRDIATGKQTADSVTSNAFKELDGKTADQVIARADAIIAERQAREREQGLKEIQELTAVMEKAEANKAELSKFVVQRSRFQLRDKQYSSYKEPIIELTVSNGTAHPVSRAYFKGTIASPGRSVPWLVEEFNYTIAGGIEPGEVAEWALAPNMFSDWGKVQAPDDAVFTVEVTRLDGADQKPLYDARGLTEQQQNRLAELRKRYQ